MKAIDVSFSLRREIDRLARELARDGMRAVQEAYHTAEFTSRTGNLFDSFGSAVYYDGVLREDTIFTLNPTATSRQKWYGEWLSGEEEIYKYFHRYHPRAKGLTLVVAAAMPYYEILEHGKGYLTRKYKVITGANAIMREIAQKYEGKFGGRRKYGTTVIHVNRLEDEQ